VDQSRLRVALDNSSCCGRSMGHIHATNTCWHRFLAEIKKYPLVLLSFPKLSCAFHLRFSSTFPRQHRYFLYFFLITKDILGREVNDRENPISFRTDFYICPARIRIFGHMCKRYKKTHPVSDSISDNPEFEFVF
jgi:hypothetical protein